MGLACHNMYFIQRPKLTYFDILDMMTPTWFVSGPHGQDGPKPIPRMTPSDDKMFNESTWS